MEDGIRCAHNLQDLRAGTGSEEVDSSASCRNDKPIMLGLRLKIVNGQITEAEHLIARNLSARSLANLETPRPGLLAHGPARERVPRARC